MEIYMEFKMHGICILWCAFFQLTLTAEIASANVLDVACINFNPVFDASSSASYSGILNGASIASEVSFQRSVDLSSGARQSNWCPLGDAAAGCGLPEGSTVDAMGRVTFDSSVGDKFGVYGCRAERYNWTTMTSTLFIRDDAHFTPKYFTVRVSLDEEVSLVMNPGSSGGSGSLSWHLNHVDGRQSDLSSRVSSNSLNISRANKEDHAGIHHYFYTGEPDRGGLMKLIVRGCLDNYWGPECQYTCPTCYNGGVCDDVSGRCVCPPGFTGDHCQTACDQGKFGQGCLGSCEAIGSGRNDCSGAVFCLPDPYGCSCAAGWMGLNCNQACPGGTYGAGCTETCHCNSSEPCDLITGACSNGCEDGWTGDQCQVTVLDITSVLRRGGVHDAADGTNFVGIFMIGDSAITGDLSLRYYIGREVDTGPGETGHGAYFIVDGGEQTQDLQETGLPLGTSIVKSSTPLQHSLRAGFDKTNGGDARVGAYRMSVDYKGWTERNILLNEYRGDSNSEVWPEKLSSTTGVGETVTLAVSTNASVSTSSLRWRVNGGSVRTEWNGVSSVTIKDVRKSDEGIYECYVQNNRESGNHAILKLIVRSCPSSKYGFNCSKNCPVCYGGGICHDITGECVCRSGFQGVNCETLCGDNLWGKSCTVKCSSSNPGCPERLFSPPDPVGMSCIIGYEGNRCQTECSGDHFGAGCELACNCDGTCDRITGCAGQCSDNFEGTYCQALRSDLACPDGYFGTLCKYPCHCEGGMNCERTSGHCPSGVACAEGWAGSDCQQALPRLLQSPYVFDVTNDSVLLVWNAWTDGYDYGNGPADSYQVDYTWTDDTGITGRSETPMTIEGDSTAEITGLFGFRNYSFYVRVRSEVEGQVIAGVTSGPISARTDCGAPLLEPTILSTIVNGTDSVTLEWEVPETPSSSWLQCDSTIFGYNLTYWPKEDPTNSTTIPVDSSGDVVVQTVQKLDSCTEYMFSVVIVNSINLAGPANWTSAMTEKIPPQPVESADAISDSYNHLMITWSEPFSQCGAPIYNVSRRLLLLDQCDDSFADTVTWEVRNDSNIEYDDLLPYSTYEFTVLATIQDYDAESVYLITHNSTESNSTAAPEDLSVDTAVKGELEYRWNSPPCGDRRGAVSYDYAFQEEGGVDLRTGNLMATNKLFDGLKHYVTYDFEVCPRTTVGTGPCIFNQTRTLPSEPTRILGFDSEDGSTNQTYIAITWEKPQLMNGVFVRYDIQKNEEDIINIEDEEDRSYSFSDLEPDTEYSIRVRAVSNGGPGPWDSKVVRTVPIPEPGSPETPFATAKTSSSITIEWPHINNVDLGIYQITSYTVSYSSSTGGENTADVKNITDPMVFTISQLKSVTEYYIKVRAVNEGGPGGWSGSLIESTEQIPNEINALAIGMGVGIPLLIFFIVSTGFIFYKKRRNAPPPPSKEYDLENVNENEYGGSSNLVPVHTTNPSNSKPKPPLKKRPSPYQPIPVSDLGKEISAKRMSHEEFGKEFKALVNRSDEGCIGSNPENKSKNRYKNIITYDEHRVKLNRLPTEPGADYINATFIDGYKKENAFIATQGPNDATLDGFWQMVYEQRTATIVMLTNLRENNKPKCSQYWPISGELKRYGELEVFAREVKEEGSYVLRMFDVGKPGRTPHRVSQYHYTIWPDMEVPESSQPLLDFRDIVKSSNPKGAGPIIVHCSAGVGRTGTYISIDCMMEMIEAESKIDVFNFVNNMRKRRAYMVQVQQQYEFIYETLLQWTVCKKVSFSLLDLQSTVKSWKTTRDASGKTEMLRQYEVLEFMAPRELIGMNQKGSAPENAPKNRYPHLVPVDKSKPLLMTPGEKAADNDYINASFFDVEGRKNAHVCTQCPLKSTVGDFWRLVWDYEINTIIHLNEMDSTCTQYWPDSNTVESGSFTIELLSDRKLSETMFERVLQITSSKKKGKHKITQFQYLGWPNHSLVPSSKMDFFDLLMQAENNNASEKKFLIVCMDGVGASPTFLAALAAIDKVREDKVVDVFSAVKRLRKSRPGVVDKLERYEFCYDVLAAYQDSVQTYANYM
ncbi:receptor-type tyrosine-protein phosphatase delta-like isoform X1 [Lytechinus pictus]|uniref:receptor-type tyrosine-protein phosphatase delta-like isoform X1 n=1 Tax=Lytechinus pictus TaxID=7653 RepID=UPI0030BA1E00